jgi:hypothetical protein
MNPKNDLTQLIERLEAFEERCGVRLEALFASIDPSEEISVGGNLQITVNGELHPRAGPQLHKNITLVFDTYDKNARLVATDVKVFITDGFYGFETFSNNIYSPISQISKIRVYPRFSK